MHGGVLEYENVKQSVVKYEGGKFHETHGPYQMYWSVMGQYNDLYVFL